MNKEIIKAELKKLLQQISGIKFLHNYIEKLGEVSDEEGYEELIYDYQYNDLTLSKLYNSFYTKACCILQLILPERLDEFKQCYIFDSKAKVSVSHSTISKYFQKNGTEEYSINRNFEQHIFNLFTQQENILESAADLIDSALYKIENEIQYSFYTDELATAEHLLSKKYIKPAGAIAGVALESHLKNVCLRYPQVKIGAKDTLSKFIEHLKKADIIDTTMSKKLIFLADIRNLCAHKADREATKEEVQDLIIGVKKILVDVN